MHVQHRIGRRGLVLGFALLGLAACHSGAETSGDDRQPYVIPDSLLKTLAVDSVRWTPLVNAFTLSGQVDFNQDNFVNMYPLISGNIDGIKVALGDYVTKGEVLGVVKSPEMAQYSSDILNAETNLELAQKTLDKTIDMYHSGLASLTDSLSAEVALQQAKAELTRSQRVLHINGGGTEGEYVLKAPIDGFIVQKFVVNGQAIRTDNSTALFTISDLKDVWVWANVYEANLDKIHMGDAVNVTTLSYPGRVFKGRVDKIMHVLDPTSKVMKVRVVMENPDFALRPQMFTTVTVTNNAHQSALCIPTGALVYDHSQYYVLVYQGGGKANITPVGRLSTLGDTTYLTSGVKPGDKVIASDALQVYDQLNN
jgi:cobalt-zinc-cadmium efflux system membrane fusion protein